MQLIIHIPDDLIERVKDQLPPPEMGLRVRLIEPANGADRR
jgi:hypothetical protein